MPAIKTVAKTVRVPPRLMAEFSRELRVVIDPRPGLFPIDARMLARMKPEVWKEVLSQYDLMLVPKG